MKNIFLKIFCLHKWYTHKSGEKKEQSYFPDKNGEYKPSGVIRQFNIDVLICKECGKIKKIEY